jgi:hypothetical protein
VSSRGIASIAALVVGLSLPTGAQAPQPGPPPGVSQPGGVGATIFTTTDFRQDRERWTDPA